MKLQKEEKYLVVLMISHYKNVILIVNLGWINKKKKTIFHEYWNLDCHTRRSDYIASSVTQKKTIVTRKKVETSLKERNFTYNYFLLLMVSVNKFAKNVSLQLWMKKKNL